MLSHLTNPKSGPCVQKNERMNDWTCSREGRNQFMRPNSFPEVYTLQTESRKIWNTKSPSSVQTCKRWMYTTWGAAKHVEWASNLSSRGIVNPNTHLWTADLTICTSPSCTKKKKPLVYAATTHEQIWRISNVFMLWSSQYNSRRSCLIRAMMTGRQIWRKFHALNRGTLQNSSGSSP